MYTRGQGYILYLIPAYRLDSLNVSAVRCASWEESRLLNERNSGPRCNAQVAVSINPLPYSGTYVPGLAYFCCMVPRFLYFSSVSFFFSLLQFLELWCLLLLPIMPFFSSGPLDFHFQKARLLLQNYKNFNITTYYVRGPSSQSRLSCLSFYFPYSSFFLCIRHENRRFYFSIPLPPKWELWPGYPYPLPVPGILVFCALIQRYSLGTVSSTFIAL